MTVSDILTLSKIRLHNLPVIKNEDALIHFIYLGVSELYRKFNLSIKSETIKTCKERSLYELRNDDVNLLLSVFYVDGRELRLSDVFGALTADYKILNYRSFLLTRPFEGTLYAMYKASPIVLKDANDIIDLPDAMIDCLLEYVAYMAHNTLNRDNMQEAVVHMQRFTTLCSELEMQGYKVNLSTETISMYTKGFI